MRGRNPQHFIWVSVDDRYWPQAIDPAVGGAMTRIVIALKAE